MLYKLLRPELVRASPVPLNSDAFTSTIASSPIQSLAKVPLIVWTSRDPNRTQYAQDLRDVTLRMRKDVRFAFLWGAPYLPLGHPAVCRAGAGWRVLRNRRPVERPALQRDQFPPFGPPTPRARRLRLGSARGVREVDADEVGQRPHLHRDGPSSSSSPLPPHQVARTLKSILRDRWRASIRTRRFATEGLPPSRSSPHFPL